MLRLYHPPCSKIRSWSFSSYFPSKTRFGLRTNTLPTSALFPRTLFFFYDYCQVDSTFYTTCYHVSKTDVLPSLIIFYIYPVSLFHFHFRDDYTPTCIIHPSIETLITEQNVVLACNTGSIEDYTTRIAFTQL